MSSSIDVIVPDARLLIGRWYSLTDAAVQGMPPHVTLLWPWVDPPLDAETVGRVGRAVGGLEPFEVAFGRVGRFPGAVYLAPEPRDPFDALIARLARAFPDTPPYRGDFGPTPVPHLTVATGPDEDLLDRIEAELVSVLAAPLRMRVDHVAVSVRGPGEDARWAVLTRVPLTVPGPR